MNKKIIAELKEKLEKEKISLQKELESFAKKDKDLINNWNARYPNHEDRNNMEEEANEAQEYDSFLSLEHGLELKLKDVNLALDKIKKENYGICEKCGKKINRKRLQACPEARLCMKCK